MNEKAPSVLFVCTGNICRSPMAAAIFKAQLEKEGLAWKVDSAGVWAEAGLPASAGAVQMMAQRGLDISGHRSQGVSQELLEQADLVLAMEPSQKEALSVTFPSISNRIFLLSEMDGSLTPIADPYGGPLKGYQVAADRIEQILLDGKERIRSQILNPGEFHKTH